MGEDPDELVIDHINAFERRVFEPLDLLLNERLKRARPDKQRRSGSLVWQDQEMAGVYGRVVEESANVDLLDVVKRVHGDNGVKEELVEDEADASTAIQLCRAQVGILAVQNAAVFGGKFGDDA